MSVDAVDVNDAVDVSGAGDVRDAVDVSGAWDVRGTWYVVMLGTSGWMGTQVNIYIYICCIQKIELSSSDKSCRV